MLLFGRSCTNQLQIALVSILSSTFLALVFCKFPDLHIPFPLIFLYFSLDPIYVPLVPL